MWDGITVTLLSQKKKELSCCTIQRVSVELWAALYSGQTLALENHNSIATVFNTVMIAK